MWETLTPVTTSNKCHELMRSAYNHWAQINLCAVIRLAAHPSHLDVHFMNPNLVLSLK